MLKIETKLFYVHLHVLCAHEVISRKTNFLCGLRKNNKIWYQNKLFRDAFFLSYLHTVGKISILHKTLCEHLEYVDIHFFR
jgi:hypothetical protein